MRIFLLGLFFAALMVPASALAQDIMQAQSYFQQGVEFKNQGNFVEAERNLKKALDIVPANPDYHFELANVYAMKYDHYSTKKTSPQSSTALSAAARELEQTLMLDPDSIQASFNLGVVYKKQGKFERAREKFRQVLEIHPALVNAHLQIGSTYEDQGFFEEARDSYLTAKDLDYGNPSIHSAIEDLKSAKKADQARMRAEASRSQLFRPRPIEFTPGSKARQYRIEDINAANNRAGMSAAIPYLSLWLVDQFMKKESDQV